MIMCTWRSCFVHLSLSITRQTEKRPNSTPRQKFTGELNYQAQNLQRSLPTVHRRNCSNNPTQASFLQTKLIREQNCNYTSLIQEPKGRVHTSVFGAAEEPGDHRTVDDAIVHGQDVRQLRHRRHASCYRQATDAHHFYTGELTACQPLCA